MHRTVVLLVCLLLSACATTSRAPVSEDVEGTQPVSEGEPSVTEPPSRVTLRMKDTTLGEVVRRIGQESSARLVLMNGIERSRIKRISFVNAEPGVVARKLAETARPRKEAAGTAGFAVQECAGYFFIFPPDYDLLLDLSLAGKLGAPFEERVDRVAFGAYVPLYTVLAWLGRALEVTIVADNAVAAARCGELALSDLPLDQALEAILKSARVAGVTVDATEEFVFLQARDNMSPHSSLLNGDDLTAEQREHLEQRVTVMLPHPPSGADGLRLVGDARRLEDVLDPLSEQLGVPVVAEKGLGELPVNPAVFTQVRVQTALDLLVRQWLVLVPEFGYQFTGDRVVIRRRTAQEKAG